MRSKIVPGEELRGGVAVLIRASIWSGVFNVVSERDQVWFSCCDIRFGAIYIAPHDSPYYSQESFAKLHEHCLSQTHTIVMGLGLGLGL